MAGPMNRRIVRFLPDGRVVMSDGINEVTCILGHVPGAGMNLIAVPDASAQPIPETAMGDQDAARVAADEQQERLREERTAQARGLSPEEMARQGGFETPTVQVPDHLQGAQPDEPPEEPADERQPDTAAT